MGRKGEGVDGGEGFAWSGYGGEPLDWSGRILILREGFLGFVFPRGTAV
jgi:hypothetical protein